MCSGCLAHPEAQLLQKNEASEGPRGRFKMAFTNTNQAKRLDPDPQNTFALIGSGRHPPRGMTLSRPYWRKLACNSANAALNFRDAGTAHTSKAVHRQARSADAGARSLSGHYYGASFSGV
jgi:hypothetical protein